VGATENNTEQTLQRILATVERAQRKEWVQIVSAILLSLATTASAWCAYQSKLWAGAQGDQVETADEELRQANENQALAGEIRVAETAVILKFVDAKVQGNDALADFFAARLQPPTRVTLLAARRPGRCRGAISGHVYGLVDNAGRFELR
jgi:hypothetical protein